MRLAVIPARGGSKRIPGKNTRSFAGQPIIAWPIRAALESGCFDHVVVSTESDEIAQIAEAAGATAPFRRPAELATDHTATRPVVNHAIRTMQDQEGPISAVCCLYPTAAFVTAEVLAQAFDRLEQSGAEFVFSCTSYAYPIQRALTVAPDGGVSMLWPENRAARSQDLAETYHDAGQFYWGRTQPFLDGKPAYSEQARAFILPRYRVQDIDTEEDFIRAELAFRALQEIEARAEAR